VHVVASSCFIAFISICIFLFFLIDGASSMQMICNIFKVFVFLPLVFCGLGSDFVEWHLFQICFLSLWWFWQSSSQKIVFILLCSWYNWKWKCDCLWGHVELNSQAVITVTSFWFESKSHPTYMHCLPSCPQINITHSGMNQMTATVCYMGNRLGSVIGWSPRIVGTDITKFSIFPV